MVIPIKCTIDTNGPAHSSFLIQKRALRQVHT